MNISNEYEKLLSEEDEQDVLLCGFFGAENVGDELMLEAVLKNINVKKNIYILLANNYKNNGSKYKPYKIIHYPSTLEEYEVIVKKFKKVILCGGAMIDDNEYGFNGEYSSMSYILLTIIKKMLMANKKASVIGVSSNEKINSENKEFLNDLQYVIDFSNYFSLRDRNSLKTIKRAEIKTKKVKIVDDLALGQSYEVNFDNNKDFTRIDLIYIYNNNENDWLIDFTKKVIDKALLMNGKKIKVVFNPFYSYNDYDLNYCKEIKKKMSEIFKSNKRVEFFIGELPSSCKKMSSILKETDFVISSRYHATLLFAVYGKKMISLDYSKKHRHYNNKIKNIKDKYFKKMVCIEYNESNVEERIEEAFLQKRKPLNRIRLCWIRYKIKSVISREIKE